MTDEQWEVKAAEIDGEVKVMNTRMGHIEEALKSIRGDIKIVVFAVLLALIARLVEFALAVGPSIGG